MLLVARIDSSSDWRLRSRCLAGRCACRAPSVVRVVPLQRIGHYLATWLSFAYRRQSWHGLVNEPQLFRDATPSYTEKRPLSMLSCIPPMPKRFAPLRIPYCYCIYTTITILS